MAMLSTAKAAQPWSPMNPGLRRTAKSNARCLLFIAIYFCLRRMPTAQ